jgi:hypothetical protein
MVLDDELVAKDGRILVGRSPLHRHAAALLLNQNQQLGSEMKRFFFPEPFSVCAKADNMVFSSDVRSWSAMTSRLSETSKCK